jgi:murein DD-endopeptidase MepM/ murein hydrolase activator NlpD
MAPKFASLMFIPEDGRRLRQYRIPLWPVYSLAGVCLLGLAIIVSGLFALKSQRQTATHNSRLIAENQALRGELVLLGTQIVELDQTVQEHLNLANESRLLAGLPPYSPEVGRLGVGGLPPVSQAPPPSAISSPLGKTVSTYQDRLQQLDRQLTFQQDCFVEVKDLLESERQRLDHIPTIHPVAGQNYCSSGFGMRRDPFTGQPSRHYGLDFAARRGTPIKATADGVITFAGKNGSIGITAKIDHGNGYVTIYGHCNKLVVKKGQQIRRGDVIGEIGNTGRSTGDHLHYEIRQNGKAVNPHRYLLDS